MARIAVSPLVLSIALAGVASGCGLTTGPSIPTGVLGTWSWIESSGGIAGMTLTPESTGDSITLRFVADRAQLVRNGIVERTVGFTTGGGTDRASLEIRYDEPLMGFETQTATFPSDSVLVLTDPCCDGFVSRYVRVR